MRITVLGRFGVSVEGRDVTPSAPKQRLLLALLVSRVGRSVSVDRLADVVWGLGPPASAREQLRWHVHHLRQALGNDECLERTAEGYALVVGPDVLDVAEFERRCREGMAVSDARDVSERLAAALELWRGRPYEEFTDARELAVEADRVAELRLAALERRIDADLELNRQATVIGELEALVAEYPLRERFREQLMRALGDCGRRDEALEVFRHGRELMIEELGLEPNARLCELERELLGATVPAELPADLTVFTAREAEVSELDAALRRGVGRPIVLTGPGGVGKSTLAVHVAHRLAAEHPDGQLYVNLHGAAMTAEPLEPTDILARLLRSLDVHVPAGRDADQLAALFGATVANRRVLVVLDDARDAEQVRPVLPAVAGCATLITGRGRLESLDGVRHHRLDVLSEADARQLLATAIGSARATAEPGAVAELATLCGRLPLALAIVGARLRVQPRWPISVLLERMRAEDRRLTELEVDDHAVRGSFEVGYRAVAAETDGAEAARMFRLFGLYPGIDIGLGVAAALADTTERHAEALLQRLVDTRLAESHRPNRYRLHDLLHLYARELALAEEPEPRRAQAVRRVALFHLATARNVFDVEWSRWQTSRLRILPSEVPAGIPLRSQREARSWVDAELGNMIAVIRAAVHTRDDDVAVGIAVMIAPALRAWGYWREQVTIGETALPAAERRGANLGRYFVDQDLAAVKRSLGRLDEALRHGERAVELARRFVEPGCESGSLSMLGAIHRLLGNHGEAERRLRAALAVPRNDGEWLDESVVHMRLGLLYRDTDRLSDELEEQERALQIARHNEDVWNEVSALGNIGYNLCGQGRAAEAVTCFERTLRLVAQSGLDTTALAADQHWGYACARYARGHPEPAREHWRIAADILYRRNLISADEREAIVASRCPPMPSVLDP